MIDFKGKNSPLLTKNLRLHGFKVAHTGEGLHGFDMRDNSNSMIDILVQQVIDAFDEVAADKEQRITEIDERAKLQAWRPIASDLRRVIDARQFDADGRPKDPGKNQYLWLVDAAGAQGVTLDAMADIILNKETAARLIEKKRLDDKAAIRA